VSLGSGTRARDTLRDKNGLTEKPVSDEPKIRIRDFGWLGASVVVRAVGRRGVGRVVRTTEVVAVDAGAGEMSPSHAKVIPADASDMTHTRTTDMGAAKCPHVTSVEATDVGSTEATHVTSAKASTKATTMSAAATAGLRTSGNEAAGKQRSCQNHHPSSFHDLFSIGIGGRSAQDLRQTLAPLNKANADVAIDSKMGILLGNP
jgi:hypothetical protein